VGDPWKGKENRLLNVLRDSNGLNEDGTDQAVNRRNGGGRKPPAGCVVVILLALPILAGFASALPYGGHA
jgi:hypothetical protein